MNLFTKTKTRKQYQKLKKGVLRAEWAYLNRPERLIRLAEANFETLGLVPVRADHYADPGQVAYKPEEPNYSMMLNVTTAAARTSE